MGYSLTYGQRTLLFYGACLPLRGYLAYRYHETKALRAFYGGVATYWLLNAGDVSKVEGFFGGPFWWRDVRLGHALLLATYAATGQKELLAADLVLAVGAHVVLAE